MNNENLKKSLSSLTNQLICPGNLMLLGIKIERKQCFEF